MIKTLRLPSGIRAAYCSAPGSSKKGSGSLRFQVSAHSFFQTNTLGAQKLYETVSRLADFEGAEKVWDLYCGTGSIGLYIASRVKSVVGIELVEDAVHDARENCRINNIGNCSFLAGDLKDMIGKASQMGRPDVVIVDPPRAGMHPKVAKALLESPAGANYRRLVQSGKSGQGCGPSSRGIRHKRGAANRSFSAYAACGMRCQVRQKRIACEPEP